MPRRYGPDGTRLWYGKAPGDFNEADVARFMAETEAVLQKRELLGGRDDAKTIAQQLAEGRAQAARENAARPAPAKGKSEGWFYGLGFWTRGNAEVCLLATRGHPKRQAANVHQFIISPIQEHSRKPEEAREKIVALMGDVPRVELFARQSPPGWDVWGNEVESTLPDFWTKCPEVAGPERSD